VSAPEASEHPLLDVTDLRVHFVTPRGRVHAVHGVSLTLERGRTLGLVGESGSGKTVFSRALMNLLPRRGTETSGSVRFGGKEILGLGDKEMRAYWGSEMSMVFQDPMTSLNPVMRVGNQLTEAIREHLEVTSDYADELAESLLTSMRIPEPRRRMREYPHELSGGMRQRVCIAIALACGPQLLVADEPTTALDVTVQAQVLELVEEEQRERFMAVLLITHDLGVVAGRTDDIAVIYAGRIVERAPTTVLFAEMRMPYTQALLAAVPRASDPSHARLATIPGRPPDLVAPPAGCTFAPRCAYAQERCFAEEPPLLPGPTPGHEFRCWFPVGTPAGDDALARNVASRVPAALALERT
jgi:peptide/nickel transport system ATP-binding protein